ncbi:hypothetical protein GCM10022419_015710 [Nonomuraea rosea]|uniref:Uncharacterized protein n=1 Tax=Nonomuraea rosea TaxID=638574 RepID=A0ABP6VPF9_9ACTN
MTRYYHSAAPRDLSRPRRLDKKPGNPEIMRALQEAVSARPQT